MKQKISKGAFCFLLTIFTLFSSVTVLAKASSVQGETSESLEALSEDVRVGSRLLELFLGERDSLGASVLIPGGDVFGVRIKQNNVTVTDPGKIPALKRGDVIISVNNKEIHSTEDITRILRSSGGESLTIRARRGADEMKIEARPMLSDGEYKLGVSLRDGALGIGTVTFIDPETGVFGGLGHGICDSESGEIISMRSGDVTGVILGGIHRGERGKPGELTGILTDEDIGDLYSNSECGVFGIIDPSEFNTDKAIPVGKRETVHEGEATIISTVKNGRKSEYKIEISEIDKSSDGSKSFKIKVIDPALKALTGGIVRGMSGSPILQDGRLIGAVTHVMVNDPTEGYGIFIENMLNSANTQNSQKKAA